jgi:putative redox protein
MVRHEQLKDTMAMPALGKPPAVVKLTWAGEHRFDAGVASGGPTIRLDASRKTGPSPVDALMSALGACTGVDVVDILAKRRTPVASLDVEVTGARAPGTPARVVKSTLIFTITGDGIEREHAERAIDLAITKYCSVRDSLDPNMAIEWKLVLNGN